ncbi:uncharacterized protein [Patagioenas fasciata]|uniref:uncharacterized protein n=1 Tax=Patagioenas fasciata TaxID=372321 RepID=UPI003A99907D
MARKEGVQYTSRDGGTFTSLLLISSGEDQLGFSNNCGQEGGSEQTRPGCGILRRPTASCGVLRRPVASYGVLRRPAASYGVLRRPAVSYGVLRCPTASCGVLRHPAASYGVLRRPTVSYGVLRRPAASCGVLRCPAASYGVLRRPAASCGVLRRPAASYGVLRQSGASVRASVFCPNCRGSAPDNSSCCDHLPKLKQPVRVSPTVLLWPAASSCTHLSVRSLHCQPLPGCAAWHGETKPTESARKTRRRP